jgi:hypothetical protein
MTGHEGDHFVLWLCLALLAFSTVLLAALLGMTQ